MHVPLLRRTVRLRHHGALLPVPGSDRLVSACVGPAGEAVALWSDSSGMAALVPGDGRSDPVDVGPMEGPAASVAVTVQQPALRHTVRVADFVGTAPLAQPLPDGRVLVTGTWARWRPGRLDLNAGIYAEDGTLQLSACLGDGIQDVVATAHGAVWAAYHDMGIYGNNGWGEPGTPEPVGAAGLVRFSPHLDVEWEFPGDQRPQHLERLPGPIDDCEAITLSGDTLWACCYPDVPVVRVEDGRVLSWASEEPDATAVSGTRAFATDGRRVALAGGSPGTHDRVVVARLEGTWRVERTIRLVLPNGSRVPADARVHGCADTLHVFAGRDWYQVDVDQL